MFKQHYEAIYLTKKKKKREKEWVVEPDTVGGGQEVRLKEDVSRTSF